MSRFVPWFNFGAFVANMALFVWLGHWWSWVAGTCNAAAFAYYSRGTVRAWWHGLFHMAEPCGLCGHTRKHNRLASSNWCSERVDPAIYHGISDRCLCKQEDLDEHRRAEASSNGGAGAPASPGLSPPAFPGLHPGGAIYIGAGPPANPGLGAGSTINRLITPQITNTILGQLPGQMARAQSPLKTEPWAGEVYRGWRAFKLDPDMERGVFRLRSIVSDTVWEGDICHAECRQERYDPIQSMLYRERIEVGDFGSHMSNCTCGVYLMSSRELAVKQTFGEGNFDAVLGECVGWGTVVEHADGYRVEHCRIEGLWTLTGKPELCERLSALYGVPAKNLWAEIAKI